MPRFIQHPITIYTRHRATCEHRADESFRRCKCLKWLRYTLDCRQRRVPTGVRSWAEAEQKRRETRDLLSGRLIPPTPVQVAKPLTSAIELFLLEKQVEGVSGGRIARYKRELGRLVKFCKGQQVVFVQGLSREVLIGYCATFQKSYPSTLTRSSVRARLRSFLRFCYEAQWIPRIPALPKIKEEEPPTLPLTPEEFGALLNAVAPAFPTGAQVRAAGGPRGRGLGRGYAEGQADRCRALLGLMRHSGLAIHDAVGLRRAALRYDAGKNLHRVETHRQKTGGHVSVPLPPAIAEALAAVASANSNPEYVFWTGRGVVRTAVSHWQEDFRRLFKLAGIAKGGNMLSHRLRDTFAVDLLEKGVPMEEVSKLLGHTSIRTTEKHYAKWSKGRQDRLDALVTGTWKEVNA